MKTKSFISFAACVAASVLMCGCSNEESADGNGNGNGQLTAFAGGVVTEAPMERVQIGTSEKSTVVPGISTRTSIKRDEIGGQGAFIWTYKDAIYVEDDNGKLYKSQNRFIKPAPRATFYVGGFYNAKSQYDVYYCGTNSAAGEKKVVIKVNQVQLKFANPMQLGGAGDCGVAKAKKTIVAGRIGYKFDLEHKASYLCFLPYIPSEEERRSYKIQSIEITSDNNIAGTYDLTQSGLSATGTNESKTITFHVGSDGLLLADQTTKTISINNSLYVVIAPGTHALKVKYTVLDTNTNAVMTMTKSYGSHNYAVNRICDIPVRLSASATFGSEALVYTYSGHDYYMWDAKENYWSGHEWDSHRPWQPPKAGKDREKYPRSKDDPRWYNEVKGRSEATVNPLFKKLPNANEMAWYIKGGGYYDSRIPWTAFGHIYKGGIWLKKLSVIAQENGKTLASLQLKDPKGKDLRITSTNDYKSTFRYGKPSDSEISKYFFLPWLSYYKNGSIKLYTPVAYYWSSSADPLYYNKAYCIFINGGTVSLISQSRDYGCLAMPFE